MIQPEHQSGQQTPRPRHAFTLVELLAGTIILAFLLAATATLFTVGGHQQNLGRYYSKVQTDMRTGLRTMTRTLRHGNTVVASSTTANFPSGSRSSSASQVIVQVPEPTGASTTTMEIRFYVSGGVLYSQRGDSTSSQAIIDGVQSLTINYYRTVSGTRTAVDGTPATATEVLLTISATYGTVTSTATAYTALRNAIGGL